VAQHGLARLPWEQEVAGSNPVAPTIPPSAAVSGLRLKDIIINPGRAVSKFPFL
jgi:hypothetical protein